MNIILDKINSKNIMSAKLWIENGSRNDPKNHLRRVHGIRSKNGADNAGGAQKDARCRR